MRDLKDEFIKIREVADAMHTTPEKLAAMILNGTVPIGGVADGKPGEHRVTVISKVRLEKWLAGEL